MDSTEGVGISAPSKAWKSPRATVAWAGDIYVHMAEWAPWTLAGAVCTGAGILIDFRTILRLEDQTYRNSYGHDALQGQSFLHTNVKALLDHSEWWGKSVKRCRWSGFSIFIHSQSAKHSTTSIHKLLANL